MRRKTTAIERGAKRWLCRHLRLLNPDGTYPKDRDVCQWIADRTGRRAPGKQDRKRFMAEYWLEIKAAAGLPDPAPTPPRRFLPASASRSAFYQTQEWRELRYRALKLYGAACQCCGRTRRAHGVILHVDHIKPRSKHPELELEIANLQILCEDCNLGKLHKDQTDWRPASPARDSARRLDELIVCSSSRALTPQEQAEFLELLKARPHA